MGTKETNHSGGQDDLQQNFMGDAEILERQRVSILRGRC